MKHWRWLFLCVLLASCGSGDSPAGTREDALRAALETGGFTIGVGTLFELDTSGCCLPGETCSGNNPSSPYLAVSVPDGPGQVAPNPVPHAFRLRADEALLYVGMTPPSLAYFGYTPYVFDRDDGAGGRAVVFASLSETLNHEVIGVEGGPGVYERPTVVIVCGDQGTDARIRSALAAAGYPAGSINTLVLDPTLARFGLDAADDTFSVIQRVALPDDQAALDAYTALVPGFVWRLSPAASTPNPFPAPVARAKNLANDESGLAPSVVALAAALVQRYQATHTATQVDVDHLPLITPVCLGTLDSCLGDNRDTLYPTSDLFPWLGPSDFVVCFGVNHAATGKATYASAAVLALDHVVGVEAATSRDWTGSANDLLPGDPNAPLLYAFIFARANPTSNPFVRVISTAPCPDGIQEGEPALIVFRTYVEPGYATAPHPTRILLDRILRFTAIP